jgi:hypothetical protein
LILLADLVEHLPISSISRRNTRKANCLQLKGVNGAFQVSMGAERNEEIK